MLEGLKVAGAQIADANTGEVQGQRDGKEGHGGGHRQPRLQQRLADGAQTEAGGETAAEGQDVAGA